MRQCLQSLAGLTYPRDKVEIVIADACSTDDTVATAKEFGCVVVTNERKLVVSGRNIGFKHSRGEFVAFTDADCLFDPEWLTRGVSHFSDACVGGVGGKTRTPFESSDFEKAIDFLFWSADSFHSTSHRQHDTVVRKVRDIPGCNCIYRREALEKVMPVDENLLTAEDVWMNYLLRKSGYTLLYDPCALVWHHRRNSPGKFLRQMYRFAIGRLQVIKKAPQLLNVFHVVAGVSLPLFGAVVIMAICFKFIVPLVWVISGLIIGMMLMAWFHYRTLAVAWCMPLMLVLFCMGWSAGFLRELIIPMTDAKGK